MIAGSAEAREGHASYRERIIRLGDVSSDGLREKARFVLGEMERRMAALGFASRDTTAAQVYTVHDLHPFLADELVKRGAAHAGLTWHYCRPPVVGLDYEMDCRGVACEDVVMAGKSGRDSPETSTFEYRQRAGIGLASDQAISKGPR